MKKVTKIIAIAFLALTAAASSACGRSAESCKQSPGCAVMGLCSSVGGKCAAATEQDCKESSGCKNQGFCTLQGNACVVGGDADCKASTACTKEKKCKANVAAKRCE